ncbi:MAG: hypothetical protein GEV28_02995 [Actinophytocola sp.]|nr:hypothetical protein [Actinophytocola sp.]
MSTSSSRSTFPAASSDSARRARGSTIVASSARSATGASGFLLKDATPDELVSAVRVVAAGEALLAPTVTSRLIAHFARQPSVIGTPPRLDGPTPREREVLVLIARGLSNKEIAARLVVAEQTVRTHIGRILGKLALCDRAQAVMVAYESGLVAPGADPMP